MSEPLNIEAPAKTPLYILTISVDTDVENPSSWGGWKMISFNNRHKGSKDIWEYFEYASGKDSYTLIGNEETEANLKTGHTFIASLYEHSGSSWSLRGEGQSDRWDTTEVAGILVWEGGDDAEAFPADFEKRKESARAFLEVYNDWANGNCYCYDLTDREGNEVASCSGYYGEEHFTSGVKDVLEPKGITRLFVNGDSRWIMEFQQHVLQLGEGVEVEVANEEHDTPDEEDEA